MTTLEPQPAESLSAQCDAVVWRNRFDALFDRLPVPTMLLDDGRRVRGVNPAFATLFGQGPSRLRGQLVTSLMWTAPEQAFDSLFVQLSLRRQIRQKLRIRWRVPATNTVRTGLAEAQMLIDRVEGPMLLVTLEPESERPILQLTNREMQILRGCAAGKTSAAIGADIEMTSDGVSYHLNRLSRRLNVPNRAALTARAYTLGLLDVQAWPPQ